MNEKLSYGECTIDSIENKEDCIQSDGLWNHLTSSSPDPYNECCDERVGYCYGNTYGEDFNSAVDLDWS